MPSNHLKFHSADGKRKILVVEDEMINREMLKFLIQDDYALAFAETGKEAFDCLEREAETLSLVLLDLNLPDMKGVEILRRMKGDGKTARLPVIVMTADADAEVECLNLGATDFIPKPYPKREVILARILRTIELFEDRDILHWTERDQLTGLYNRAFFYRYAAQFDTFHPDTETDAVVLDINHFHVLNDRYGSAYGDKVLRSIADTLLGAVGGASDGIVCRREADTFLIYCPHREDYEDILQRVSVCMAGENQLRIRMGVYARADRSIEIERRFDRAKMAADTVKNSFSQAIAFYDNSMHEKEAFAEQLVEDFHTAIEEKQFSVYFQPKFDIRPEDPQLSSAEALVRWKHPEFGMISPGIFIPLFEENGLIRELDSFVWRETASWIRKWKETLNRTVPVSINVSRIDLYEPRLLENLEGLIREYGLKSSELLLEITESAYTEDSTQMIATVRSLRERGFRIEMDDFGTGYSSLNMFSALPIDMLKLDMQFVRNAFQERKDTRLLEAIIGLAKSMGLPTIAEGVETAEQMFTLKAMGCDYVQGYYFSRPLPAEEFTAFIRDQKQAEPVVRRDIGITRERRPSDHHTYNAMHDPLTGLYNNSAFNVLFRDADKDHIAVMIASVDHYQQIRETQGKEKADEAILRVAQALRGSFRSVDNICRIQQDEFVVILSRMISSMKKQVFEKVEQINQALQESWEGDTPLSLSVGIAFSDRQNPQGDVFDDADIALQRMKQMRKIGCAVY